MLIVQKGNGMNKKRLTLAILIVAMLMTGTALAIGGGITPVAPGRILGAKAYSSGDTVHATVYNNRFRIRYDYLGGGFADEMYRPAGFSFPMKAHRFVASGGHVHLFVNDSENQNWKLTFELPNGQQLLWLPEQQKGYNGS